jgi:uncharacterized protein YndB with AHSA1/START domain
MNTWLIVATVVVAVIVAAIAAVLIIGSNLPVTHTVTRSVRLSQPPADVYAVVRDFSSYPEWRPDVKTVEVATAADGRVTFREDGSNGVINFELVEDLPGKRIVTRITDTDLGFGGSWTYEFSADAGGTLVTITENGEVTNLLFRFMSRYVFGHTATIDTYQNALAVRLLKVTLGVNRNE